MTLLTYNSDPALKEQFLAEIEKHRLADQIGQGEYGNDFDFTRGCAVGCSVHSINLIRGTRRSVSDHDAYEEIGIPAWLAHVEDGLFEALPADAAKLWPTRLANAIPVGVSLDGVKDRFMLWVLVDPTWGVVNTADAPDVIAANRRVADCYQRRIDGHEPTEAQWKKVGDATAAARVARAAWAARAARAAWDARDAFITASCDELIRLLESAGQVVAS